VAGIGLGTRAGSSRARTGEGPDSLVHAPRLPRPAMPKWERKARVILNWVPQLLRRVNRLSCRPANRATRSGVRFTSEPGRRDRDLLAPRQSREGKGDSGTSSLADRVASSAPLAHLAEADDFKIGPGRVRILGGTLGTSRSLGRFPNARRAARDSATGRWRGSGRFRARHHAPAGLEVGEEVASPGDIGARGADGLVDHGDLRSIEAELAG